MATARPRSKALPPAPPAPGPSSAAPGAPDPAEIHIAAPSSAAVDALLQNAAEEAARLLAADGAFLYLLEPGADHLHLAHTAGIAALPDDHWMRSLQLPIGVGMFGRAVADRRVVVTGDYVEDERFVHAPSTDRFVTEIGIRSMVVAPLSAGDEVFGALGTFSAVEDAFTAPQIALVRALADHAALAMANARLIDELAASREAIERQATIERSLRELGTRISGARDPEAVVQHTIDEALRLLGGDGARIDIVDPEMNLLRGLYSAGEELISEDVWPRDPNDRLEVGASGKAVVTGKTYISRDYLTDEQLVHGYGPDTYVRSKGIHGVIASPLFGEQGPFGAITVWSTEEDAFGPDDAALLETIAGQASVALGRARLIQELGKSRETLARRAEEERALREIASRLGAMGDDPAAVLDRIVNETARLLGAERARLDLLEPLSGEFLWTYPAGASFNDRIVPEELLGGERDGRPTGLAGLAIHEGRPVVSGDYMADTRFTHYQLGDDAVRTVGLHSVVAAPVVGEQGLLGVIQAGHRARDAFGEDALRLLDALASQAAIAITNARLVDRLATSQQELGRTADSERALREIARRMMTIQDPVEVLQDVVDEAARLLGSRGAVIDLLDPATGQARWAYDAGLDDAVRQEWQERGAGSDGVFLAIRARAVVTTPDYAADPRFGDGPPNAAFLAQVGVRSVAFAPLIGEATVLGTLAVFAEEEGRFGPDEAVTLAALADLATIAIHNAELIAALGRSREETARRAETERTLREIAARVTAIRDPDTILGLIVDETRRVLGSDGAHLTRMSEDRTFVRPVVIAGGMDEETRAWLRVQEFPLDGGINGLAAGQGRVVWTPNYATDPRIPRDDDDLEVAARMGLGAMAAAPLHAPGGEVIGTLAISYRDPGPISQDRLGMLQALADHAAIAVSNADLLARLEASEGQFRRLVQASPDVIWRNDADGHVVFVSERSEALWGYTPDEVMGKHFGFLVAEESMPYAQAEWEATKERGRTTQQFQFVMRHKDGHGFLAELSSIGIFDDEGRFAGAQGTIRDISERERLERELRESEERYRFLVENSPDTIWSLGPDGRFTFISDSVEAATGWSPVDFIGHHYSEFTDERTLPVVARELESLLADPYTPRFVRISIPRKDGGVAPTELSFIGRVEDGELVGVQGVSRDVSEREALEQELRASEERYRFLVENAPDVVFSADADTRFLFMSDTIERLTGYRPDELIGETFEKIITPETIHVAIERWAVVAADPTVSQVLRLELRRKDGGSVPVEIHSVGQVDAQGAFAGVHGSARDMSERERLERELRDSEERYRSVIQSSPDLIWATNKQGRYVFVSDRVRDLLGWEPEEVLGRPFREFIDEQSVQMTNENWARLALEPGVTQTHRILIHHRDGTDRPFEVSSVAVVRDGEVENVYGIARDVTERERLERELRESEERYRFLVENSPDIIYATDAEGVITYFSESVEQSLGWLPSEVIGRHFRDIVRTSSGQPAGIRFGELARGMPTLTARMELLDKDGVPRPFEVTSASMRIDGAFAGVHGSARDIRDRERLERELRDSEERYRYLVQSSPDLVWMTDADGTFTFISDQASSILGWEPHELLGRSFADLAPASGRRGALARFRFLQRRPTQVHRSPINVLTRDGRELAMEITGIGMVGPDGQFLGAHGAARDVSERERLERGLRRQAAELASSEERAHLARELHDSVTQALFSMTLLSRSIELLLDKDPSQVPDKLAALRELQRDALAEMRALIFELRPGNVEEHGLLTALRTHSASLSGRIGLPVVVEADLPERPPIDVEEALYRIAQEALHNVVKHAGARQVRLEVGRVKQGVRLRVHDDGRGFDPSAVPDGHLGLAGMRARAERLGGTLTVTSAHGAGTTIEVVVPETPRPATDD